MQDRFKVRRHTTWTQGHDGGRRWIYLDTNGPSWRVHAVHRDSSGAIRDREYYFSSRSEAMKLCEEMVARNGGADAWDRDGPEFTGNKFS